MLPIFPKHLPQRISDLSKGGIGFNGFQGGWKEVICSFRCLFEVLK
jgi:hypothetical protein